VHATHDPRIAGLALLNPWVRSEVSLARARVKHYYWQRLREGDFWRKLLRGGVGWGALQKFGHNVQSARANGAAGAGFQDRMARSWLAFGKPILLLLSERDLTAQEFLENVNRSAAWGAGWNSQASVLHHTLLQADHTCSSRVSAHQCEELTSRWLQLLA